MAVAVGVAVVVGVEVARGVEVAMGVADNVVVEAGTIDRAAGCVVAGCSGRSRCAAETWESERNSLATTAPTSEASTSEVAMAARNDTRRNISIINRPSWLS